MKTSEENTTRINKYLSEAGFCSRREADKLVEQGMVSINGVKAVMGSKVKPGDKVSVKGLEVNKESNRSVYLAFHKPVGIICTTDTHREKNNIIDYINYPERIFPIGRLDKESEGLILLTNDGNIVNKILRAHNNHDKEYIVRVHKPINNEFIEKMSSGVPILDTITRKCRVEQTGPMEFRIVLRQGLNRQIRRMCEHLGFHVTYLKRVRIMHITLDLPVGKYRHLTDSEMRQMHRILERSTKTSAADNLHTNPD
jgi:23S rRNA pseudouridine2604 synthase